MQGINLLFLKHVLQVTKQADAWLQSCLLMRLMISRTTSVGVPCYPAIGWFCTANLAIPGGTLPRQYATHNVKSNKESELSHPILLKLSG